MSKVHEYDRGPAQRDFRRMIRPAICLGLGLFGLIAFYCGLMAAGFRAAYIPNLQTEEDWMIRWVWIPGMFVSGFSSLAAFVWTLWNAIRILHPRPQSTAPPGNHP